MHALTKEFKARFLAGRTRLDYERSYFEALAEAAESGLYDCLSHPDIVKIAHPKQYDVADHLDAIRRVLDRIARTGIAMELNTSGLNKSYPEMNPGAVMLKEMALRGIPVVIGSDSHDAYRVGADFDKALAQFRSRRLSARQLFHRPRTL